MKGMFIQILENLISNSVYWLKQQRKLDRGFEPEIKVTIHRRTRESISPITAPGFRR